MNKKLLALTAAQIISFGLLTACGKSTGLQTTASSAAGGTNGSQGVDSGTTDALQKLDMKAYIDGGTYDSTQTFDLDKQKGELIISIPLGMDPSVMISSGQIPELKGVSFYTNLGSDGNYYLVVRIPVAHVLRGVKSLPAARLPNGDALPMIAAGELPSIAVNLNPKDSKKIYLYIGVDVVGLFIESTYIPQYPFTVTFPIRNMAKTKIVGTFSMIGPKNNSMGGFFITQTLPADVARILDTYFIR